MLIVSLKYTSTLAEGLDGTLKNGKSMKKNPLKPHILQISGGNYLI